MSDVFHENLKAARLRKGLSQQEVADQEPFCYHWSYYTNTRVYICLFCRLYLVIHVYII